MSFNPGGSGGIASASDVFFSNPATNDSLVYDTSTQKWKNLAVTKSHIGLGNVNNTSDSSKPVSTATQTALDSKVTGNGVNTIVVLSQASYAAITVKDSTTLYVVTA